MMIELRSFKLDNCTIADLKKRKPNYSPEQIAERILQANDKMLKAALKNKLAKIEKKLQNGFKELN